jgi:hypothetical protein
MDARPRSGASFSAARAWLKVNFVWAGSRFNQDVHGIDLDGHVIRAGEVIGPGISAVAVRTNSRDAISMPKAEIIKSSDPRLITTSRYFADEDDRAYLGTRPLPEWIVKDISPHSKAGATHGR